jgi:hypothetical protein
MDNVVGGVVTRFARIQNYQLALRSTMPFTKCSLDGKGGKLRVRAVPAGYFELLGSPCY